jgi:hypothetical protein
MEWNPGQKYAELVERCADILADEERTVRDIYYALEARGHKYEYREVKRAVKKGRRAGYIDPELIIDASRQSEHIPDDGHGSPTNFLDKHVAGVHAAYEEDFWKDQSTRVEVWLEKQSLASVFKPICDDHNVRLEATRGDWSDSKVFRAAKRLKQYIRNGHDVTVLYWGDFNPSGFHAPVAIQNTMHHYGVELPGRAPGDKGDWYFDIAPMGRIEYPQAGGSILFDRVGLNPEHIEQFDLPTNPNPSSTDKDRQLRERFMEAVSGRDVNVELNALKEFQREYLEERIEETITEHIDTRQRAETERRIRDRREALARAIGVDYSAVEGV